VRFERDRLVGTPEDWYPPYEMVSVDGSGRRRRLLLDPSIVLPGPPLRR